MRVIDEIKNYIHVNPDWVDNHIIPKDNIEEAGTRYAKEAIAKGTIADDIETLLSELDRLRNPKGDAEKDFYEIAFVGYNVIKAKRLANIYAIFIKGIISELNGKVICTAAQIEEWRERYAVRLEGLKARSESKELEPIGDIRAEKIYVRLKEKDYIHCNEDVFLWHFGERKHKDDMADPGKIEWSGTKTDLIIFWAEFCIYSDWRETTPWRFISNHFQEPWKRKKYNEDHAKIKNETYCRNAIKRMFESIEKEEKEEREKRKKHEDYERTLKEIRGEYE